MQSRSLTFDFEVRLQHSTMQHYKPMRNLTSEQINHIQIQTNPGWPQPMLTIYFQDGTHHSFRITKQTEKILKQQNVASEG